MHHESEWSAGLQVAVDELGEDVEADAVVGHGLDDADGQGKGVGDGDGEEKGPPGELGGIGQDDVEAEGEHLRAQGPGSGSGLGGQATWQGRDKDVPGRRGRGTRRGGLRDSAS